MTEAGNAAPKANSQAYPVDVTLAFTTAEPVVGARLCGGEAVAQPQAADFLFCV